MTATSTAPPGSPVPPRLRGWIHLGCLATAVPASVALVVTAGNVRARIAAAVYGLSLCALFGVSAAYHRLRWSPAARRRMRRLDHGTIFLMIAGTYTPICLLVLRGPVASVVLVGAWLGASIGMALAATGIAERPVLGLACYIGLGWLMVAAFPQLLDRLDGAQFALLLAGGILYTAGALVLGRRWPDPSPVVFGYHEVWHAMVAVAALSHFVLIVTVMRAAA